MLWRNLRIPWPKQRKQSINLPYLVITEYQRWLEHLTHVCLICQLLKHWLVLLMLESPVLLLMTIIITTSNYQSLPFLHSMETYWSGPSSGKDSVLSSMTIPSLTTTKNSHIYARSSLILMLLNSCPLQQLLLVSMMSLSTLSRNSMIRSGSFINITSWHWSIAKLWSMTHKRSSVPS